MIEDGLAAFASGFDYCELSGFGLIPQPVNVIGNLGFLILFFVSWYKIGMRWLTFSAFLIFLGSSLWHITLDPVALVFDILPIFLWVVLFVWAVTENLLLKSYRLLLVFLILISSVIITKTTADIIPMQSGIFVVGCILLLIASFFVYNFNRHYAFLLMQSCFTLMIAVIVRLSDLSLCEFIPIGTHWLWHLLSAYALFPLVSLVNTIQKTRIKTF